MANVYAYMRISTKEDREKQRFTRQENALTKYANDNHIEYVFQFREDVSGRSFKNRAEWQRLEKIVQSGDTIVFKDISRFTREAENGYKKYMELMNKNITLVFLDNPTVSTDYIKDLLSIADKQEIVTKTVMESMVKILLIAELARTEQERKTLSQRTKDGMKAHKEEAEKRGEEWRAGRKPGQLDKMTDELQADIVLYLADRNVKASDLMRKHDISRNTFKKYVEKVKESM